MNLARHFHSAAIESPDRTALSWEGGEVSYGSLLGIAQALRRKLVRIPRIGLLAHKSPVAYAGIQSILSIGAAYVPLNPTFPPRRNLRMVQLAGISTLIVGEECADAFAELLALHDGPLQVVTLGAIDKVRRAVGQREDVELREAVVDPALPLVAPDEPVDGTAYILFTSGSTGDPKGVMVTHPNLDSYLDSFLEKFPLSPQDRVSQTFDLTFDPSVHDQFITWKTGACLVPVPNALILTPLEFADEHGITVWFSVVSVPALMETSRQVRDGALPKLRLSMFCAEKFTWNTLQVWKRIAPNSKYANIYGPTEVTISTITFSIPDDFSESDCHHGGIPIGNVYPRQLEEIRRPDGTLCDPLEEGILWLGGDQVTPGYLDPQKTAERFVPRNGEVWYRTGDICFHDRHGRIQFVGREDFQVKVTGYRIELGEIEAALLHASGASFAVADVSNLRGGTDEIVCVLPTSCASRKKELKEILTSALPPYMVPRVWKFQDDLPLNSNGKVDRKALKAAWLAAAKDAEDA
jgi:amino acid adenylation domain-containing protein